MTILCITCLNILNTRAETGNFYEAEYIDNIYMVKYQYSTNIKFFQKARFFRRNGDNQAAYCLEPFRMFNGNSTYETTLTPRNLSEEQINKIKKIIYYGYGYGTHTENKWYAVTQFMIWQTVDPTGGDYYFTDTLNGNRVTILQDEINEINNLITQSNIQPSFTNKDYYVVEGKELTLQDENNVLNFYETTNENITINNNELKINKLEKGDYEFTLNKKNTTHNKPILFYQTNNSQNIVNVGDLEQENISFKIHVEKTKIIITKIDKDTNSITPTSTAKLDGAKYEIRDEEDNLISTLEIKNNVAEIENIVFGKYYIKEIEAGKGYTLDENIYEVEITQEEPIQDVILKNKVIEKTVKIEKKYGNNNTFTAEKNIDFEIYSEDGSLVKTISTDENGTCEVQLPYGKYTVKQINSTKGYSKVDTFQIEVNSTEEETITLKDYKIEVPNTHTSIIIRLIKYLFQILCLKK